MGLILNDWKHLKLKLLKRKISFKALYPYKGTRKAKDFQRLPKTSNLIIKFTPPFNLLVLNDSKNLSNLFHFIPYSQSGKL